MNIVLPIVFFAVVMGLFIKRMTPRLWILMIAWIILVIAFRYLRH